MFGTPQPMEQLMQTINLAEVSDRVRGIRHLASTMRQFPDMTVSADKIDAWADDFDRLEQEINALRQRQRDFAESVFTFKVDRGF
jgi:hypothetical protein